ncbi:MAG: DUF262 domain-containing protein [Gemmatimonas sp.]
MLDDEIQKAQKVVRTDAYQMSVGEIVSLYREGELIIQPDFQRLFRWNIGQKSKFIESLLLGIPVPSIFVFEKEDSKWELIDGLQRISTILEFMGALRDPDSKQLQAPSVLVATKYLPSLSNVVWERTGTIADVPEDDQHQLDKSLQLAIRRARIGVEILKRPSDNKTKYDLFQRLNAGGTPANPQELRNCIIIMVNPEYFQLLKRLADDTNFRCVLAATDDQIERQRHMEYATRFLVHSYVPYDGTLDVEEYIDDGIVQLASRAEMDEVTRRFTATFAALNRAFGDSALRRYEDGRHSGRVGLVALECIAVGVGKNIDAIMRLPNPDDFLGNKIRNFWGQAELERIMSPGIRGTTRLSRTIPFGEAWFRP